jgi:hypothetical protein
MEQGEITEVNHLAHRLAQDENRIPPEDGVRQEQ